MAERAGRAEHTPEAEPVVLVTSGDAVTLTLDDGEQLVFDRTELARAVEA